MRLLGFIAALCITALTSVCAQQSNATTGRAAMSENTYTLVRHGSKPTIVLALSGGGARGAAHVGVLRELEAAGIVPDMVVGTSIGAIVGGLWCAGYSAHELDSIVSTIDWEQQNAVGDDRNRNLLFLDQKYEQDRALVTMRFNNFSFVVPQSITSVMRFTAPFQKLFWDAPYHENGNFDSLKIPFRSVATDLVQARVVALGRGNLVEAIRASATLPLRYAPVHRDSMVLVDGGLLANIPVEVARAFHPDIVIAVNTTSPLLPTQDLDKPWNVADQIVSVMEKQFNQHATLNATVLIEPPIGVHLNTDFHGMDTLVDIGAREAHRMMPAIQGLIARTQDSLRTSLNIANDNLSAAISTVPPPTIRSIHVTGVDSNLSTHLQAVVGQPYQPTLIREQILRICRRTANTFASVSQLRFDSTTNRCDVMMDDGSVHRVSIRGNVSVTELFVSREMNIKVGDRPNADEILQGLTQLLNTDLLREVGIDVYRAPRGLPGIDIVVRVAERGSQVVRIGGRVDNERNTQLSVDLVQENILSSGVRLGLFVGGGNRNTVLNARMEIPRILESYWTCTLRGYWDSKNLYLYQYQSSARNRFEALQVGDAQEQHLGLRALFGRQVETAGRISLEFRYEAQRLFQLGDNLHSREFKPLAALAMSTIFDRQDRADFPTFGRVLKLRVERTLLSAPDVPPFTKAEFQLRNTYSLGNHALQPSLHFAFADALMPTPEFYHMGGQDMFFGMREDEQRGRQLALAQLEYRYKIPVNLLFDTYISVRYDIGGIWPTVQAIRLVDLTHGIGSTISFDTPLGPARFAVGRSFYFMKDPATVTLGPYTIYFSIGMRIQ